MSMRIDDICTYAPKSGIKAGEATKDGQYMFFTSSEDESKRYTDYQYDGEGIIMGTGGNATLHYYNGKYAVSTDCIVLNPDDRIRCKYLYYFFRANMPILEAGFKGAGLKHTNKKYIGSITIPPIPPVDEQDRIIEVLDRISGIINARNLEMTALDDLIKARFVEMFGSLEVNDKHWVERALGELCEKVIRYPTFYGMEYLESGTRVIRIGNILEDGHMETEDCNYVFVYDGVNDDYPETVIELNDIIMAVRGDGSAAKRIGIIREDELIGANISPNLIRIKASKTMDPIFLFYYLTGEIGQKRLDAYVNKTAKKNIAAKDIVKVIVPVPPLQIQQQFAAFVAQVDKSKVVVQKALNEAQVLFDSLMQQYFG